jgi:hypothetical protein
MSGRVERREKRGRGEKREGRKEGGEKRGREGEEREGAYFGVNEKEKVFTF